MGMNMFGLMLGVVIAKALATDVSAGQQQNGGFMQGFDARLALGYDMGNFVITSQSLVFSGLSS